MPTQINQPPGSKICGQCVVAMAAGVSLDTATAVFGHSHSTRTKEVARALRHFGFACDDRLTRIGGAIPSRCVIKVLWPNRKGSHWILLWDGQIFDSCGDEWKHCDWSSYLEIRSVGGQPS